MKRTIAALLTVVAFGLTLTATASADPYPPASDEYPTTYYMQLFLHWDNANGGTRLLHIEGGDPAEVEAKAVEVLTTVYANWQVNFGTRFWIPDQEPPRATIWWESEPEDVDLETTVELIWQRG